MTTGCNEALLTAIDNLVFVSGYTELKFVPISYHVDAPYTNLTGYGGADLEWGRTHHIDGIPSRSKFPLKVTVVAWQYGMAGKIQIAEPVERSFFILQDAAPEEAIPIFRL